MGSGCAIQLGPSWVNLIINVTKYINIIDFIYIIDKRKIKLFNLLFMDKKYVFQLYYEDF